MMRQRKRSVMSVAAVVMLGTGGVAGAGYAEEQEADRSQPRERAASQMERGEQAASATGHRASDAEGRLLKASDVVEYNVVDQQGEALGTISDLAIDTQRGQIAYGILTLAEPLALERQARGDEARQARQGRDAERAQREASAFAVPWAAFDLASGEETLKLTITREELAQARGFDDQWEQLSDRQWATRQHEAFGIDPYWEGNAKDDHEAREGARAQAREGAREQAREGAQDEQSQQGRATADAAPDGEMHADAPRELHVEAMSGLIGRKVHDAQDEELAEVNDFMIDTRHGHVAYAILNYGGVLGMGRRYVAVPYQALELNAEEEHFVLDATQDAIGELAFSNRDRPEMTDGPWAQRVHEVFGQEPYWQVFGYAPPSEADEQQTQEEVQPSTEPQSDR